MSCFIPGRHTAQIQSHSLGDDRGGTSYLQCMYYLVLVFFWPCSLTISERELEQTMHRERVMEIMPSPEMGVVEICK